MAGRAGASAWAHEGRKPRVLAHRSPLSRFDLTVAFPGWVRDVGGRLASGTADGSLLRSTTLSHGAPHTEHEPASGVPAMIIGATSLVGHMAKCSMPLPFGLTMSAAGASSFVSSPVAVPSAAARSAVPTWVNGQSGRLEHPPYSDLADAKFGAGFLHVADALVRIVYPLHEVRVPVFFHLRHPLVQSPSTTAPRPSPSLFTRPDRLTLSCHHRAYNRLVVAQSASLFDHRAPIASR